MILKEFWIHCEIMLQVKEITSKKNWESFLAKASYSSFPFFQSWNWGEVEKSLGFPVVRFGLFEDDTLLSVCQIIDVHAKRGHYIYLRHGPVSKNFSNKDFSFFLDFLIQFAKERNASFIRLSRFPINDQTSQEYFEQKGFKKAAIQTIDAEVCWMLDITKSEEELLKNMRKSHRYLIKKAPGYNIEIVKSSNPKDIETFLPLYKHLSERKHFVAHKGIIEEFETFAKDDQCILFLAYVEKKLIAGAMISFVGNTAVYRHSTSDENYKHIPASYLIQWEAIKEAKKRGIKLYNFWGIAPENDQNHPWRGITLFKIGFGGTYEYFVPTMDLPLNFRYVKNYLIDWISAKRKR